MVNKKASAQIGFGIMILAVLLLLGGLFVDSDKDSYIKAKNSNVNSDSSYNSGLPDNSYLFYLNETDIGRQKKVTESFPNIELGSKIEYNTVYIGNTFRLHANLFTKSIYGFDVYFSEVENVNNLMIYFTPERFFGSNDLVVKVNGREVIRTQARTNDLPIIIPKAFLNSVNNSDSTNPLARITFELDKPKWYQIWKWNKFEVSELKVVEEKQDKENNQREFNFQVNDAFLENAYVDLAISCEDVKERSEAIKVEVNGYIISNHNPSCTSRYSKITANVPLNILSNEKNTLKLETTGYYKVAYSINKVYYNDQDVYKFTINSFDDIIDVVMYGDFDKDVIDLRLNGKTMSLNRDEIKSIVSYLRFGTNELKILTKPVEIKEFVIEKNEFY